MCRLCGRLDAKCWFFSQPHKTHLYASRSLRGPRGVCLPSGPPDAKCWFECFFLAPKNACVGFVVAEMLNVGLRAFSQPRKTNLYASQLLRGCRAVCLPSIAPDATCWLECFFPAPKNACVGFVVAQMLHVDLRAFSQPRKNACVGFVMLNVGFFLAPNNAFRGCRVVCCPQTLQMLNFGLSVFSQR